MQYCDSWPTAAAAAVLGQSFMVIAVSVLVKLVQKWRKLCSLVGLELKANIMVADVNKHTFV
jgi:hypothetical protein